MRMSKKVVYHISGFDCPSCANKSEKYLNEQKEIKSATIDFQNERLYVTYNDDELTPNSLKAIIKKVESDPIEIEILGNHKKKKHSIFDVDFFVILSRIVVSLIIMILTKILVNDEEQFLLALILYLIAMVICLYDIVWNVIKNIISKQNPIDTNLLMTISAVGVVVLSSLIGFNIIPPGPFGIDLMDGVLVIVLYQVGELFEHIASAKSKDAISKAIDLRADKANLIKDNNVIEVEPETLQIGDKIIVKTGEIIPVDALIIEGNGTIDTSSLTGEPIPVDVKEGMEALSGTILKSGSLTLEVKKVFSDSTISKILELVQSSGERKSKAEKFINKFARIYTPSIFVIGIIYTIVFGLISGEWAKAIFGGLAILVVSCPCAIVISVPLAFFAGVGLASKKGIIIKGSNYLDSLCNIGTLFIDKTGTLTYGNFKIDKCVTENVSNDELMDTLYKVESRSLHPLAKAICAGVDVSEYALKLNNYLETAGQGIKASFADDILLAGNVDFLRKNGIKVDENDEIGSIIHVAKNGKYLGYVVLKDVVREDAKEMVKKLKEIGVKIVLLSGDKKATVHEVSKMVEIDEYYAELLPQQKTEYVEKEIAKKNKKLIAFAGDGINDTPSIMRADVGFAMGGIGSDVAVENADVVIMQDDPIRIYDSIKIAKKTRTVAIFNIVFSLLIKLTVIILILLGVLSQYGMIVAVLSDTGLTVLMTANSLLLIYRKI